MGTGHAHALYVHEHSPLHRMRPEVKVAATFLFVVGVALTPREAVWVFAADALVLGVVIRLARLRLRFVLARLAVILPFVAFAFLIPFIAGGEQVALLGIELSTDGLWAMWNILAKASLGATTSIVLAATTELPDLVKGMGRLRVPSVLTSIASFMIRYLEVVAAEMGRMRTAMTARGYDPRWLAQTRPIAASAGALFVRSYERGERVHSAMVARGFDGTMPDMEPARADPAQWAVAGGVAVISLALAAIAMVSS
jgi:cobalt/nickel transport system permease protein